MTRRLAGDDSTAPDSSRRGFLTLGVAGLAAAVGVRLPVQLPTLPTETAPRGATKDEAVGFRPKENYHV